MKQIQYLDCMALWDDTTLIIKNNKIQRKWNIKNGLCYNVSLINISTGREYLKRESSHPSPAPEFKAEDICKGFKIEAGQYQSTVLENILLKVSVISEYETYKLITIFKIYPECPAISSSLEVYGRGLEMVSGQQDYTLFGDGVEKDDFIGKMNIEEAVDNNEIFCLDNIHHKLGIVSLMDHTDNKDNLVRLQEDLLTVALQEEYKSNLFYLENQFTGEGLVFLKEAPLPYARPFQSSKDLVLKTDVFRFCGLGGGEDKMRKSYPFTTIAYQQGKVGRIKVLQDYQRNFRVFNFKRDAVIWYSIWGDRSRDGKMNEEYMLRSADLVEDLGMDFLYFIDGWQKGSSANSVIAGGKWSNQWEQEDYWYENLQRFPNGLNKVVKTAEQKGLKMGCWYCPDKTNDYENWERDADVLINLHKKFGFRFFKFDGVTFTTKKGEQNLMNAMHKIVQHTNGMSSIEIDITAGIRTGYFCAMQYGFLFLENRYTDWRKYYPHCVLRNFWKLSEFVDPRRMRIEFLNNERNCHLYQDDPLAPINYKADHLFAITMFANPLAWFEIPGLSEEYKERLKKIIRTYKLHREAILAGNIYPVGEEPTGFSWTGFVSKYTGTRKGYALIFRELNKKNSYKIKLPFACKGKYAFRLLAGTGADFTVIIKDTCEVKFKLFEQLSYGFYFFEGLD